MVFKRRRRVFVAVLLSLVVVMLVLCTPVLAAKAASTSSAGLGSAASGAASMVKGWEQKAASAGYPGEGLVHAIEDLYRVLKGIFKLAETVLELIWYLVTGRLFVLFAKWIGGLCDALLAVTAGTLQTAYIHTAYMYKLNWVTNANELMWIISVPILLFALVLNTVKLLHGQRQAGELVKRFGIALLICVFSVQLISTATWIVNRLVGQSVDSGITNFLAAATKENNVPEAYAGNFTGQQIMVLPFTPAGNAQLNYPPNPGVNLSQPPPPGVQAPQPGSKAASDTFSSVFLGNEGSGLLILLIATVFQLWLNIIVLLRFVFLCLLTIVTPVYVAWSVASNRVEPLAGLTGLFIRVFGLQVLFAIGFCLQMSILANTAVYGNQFGGLNPQVINVMILIGMCIAANYLFLRPAMRAALSPTTLAGGAVLETVGNYSQRLGDFIHAVGQHTGSAEMQRAGESVHQFGERAQETGQRWKESSRGSGGGMMTGKLRDLTSPAVYSEPDVYTVRPFVDKETGKVYDEYNMPHVWNRHDLAQELTAYLTANNLASPDQVKVTDDGGVRIDRDVLTPRTKREITRFFNDKPRYWHDGTSYRIIVDGQPVRIERPPDDGMDLGEWGKGGGSPIRRDASPDDSSKKPPSYEDFLDKKLKEIFKDHRGR